MRFVVFFLGILASLVTAGAGASLLMWNDFINEVQRLGVEVPDWLTESPTGVTSGNTALVLFLTAIYGVLGSLFTLFRCGRQGGALMILSALFAGFTNPWFLMAMIPQVFVGLLALFIGPLPIETPKDEDHDEDDEESDDEDDDEDEEEVVKPKVRKKR